MLQSVFTCVSELCLCPCVQESMLNNLPDAFARFGEAVGGGVQYMVNKTVEVAHNVVAPLDEGTRTHTHTHTHTLSPSPHSFLTRAPAYRCCSPPAPHMCAVLTNRASMPNLGHCVCHMCVCVCHTGLEHRRPASPNLADQGIPGAGGIDAGSIDSPGAADSSLRMEELRGMMEHDVSPARKRETLVDHVSVCACAFVCEHSCMVCFPCDLGLV